MDQTDARKLTVVRHARRDWVLATHLMNAVNTSSIQERLGSLSNQDTTIKRAVDQLFLGI
jgi:hypothetical protein